MRIVFFAICLFIFACSDKNGNRQKGTLELTDKNVEKLLRDRITYSKRNSIHKRHPGVFILRMSYFCQAEFLEIENVNHITGFSQESIFRYFILGNTPVFISFNKLFFNHAETLSKEEILQISGNLLLDENTPPDTGFNSLYIYKLGNPPEKFFNMTDTLFHYKDADILNSRLLDYLNPTCY
ncbi:MAG: hypothetical protein H6559_04460 [Lewinellaceae bacterium]|nr:hypothetical protein [Lewinellaceae bacterium]